MRAARPVRGVDHRLAGDHLAGLRVVAIRDAKLTVCP